MRRSSERSSRNNSARRRRSLQSTTRSLSSTCNHSATMMGDVEPAQSTLSTASVPNGQPVADTSNNAARSRRNSVGISATVTRFKSRPTVARRRTCPVRRASINARKRVAAQSSNGRAAKRTRVVRSTRASVESSDTQAATDTTDVNLANRCGSSGTPTHEQHVASESSNLDVGSTSHNQFDPSSLLGNAYNEPEYHISGCCITGPLQPEMPLSTQQDLPLESDADSDEDERDDEDFNAHNMAAGLLEGNLSNGNSQAAVTGSVELIRFSSSYSTQEDSIS